MSVLTLIKNKNNQPKVHFSEYLRTEDAPKEETKPEETTQPEEPKTE